MEEDQLIGIYLKDIKLSEPDFLLCQSKVDGYLIDKTTGACVKANSSSTNLLAYKSPFLLNSGDNDGETRLNVQNWNKLLVFDKSFLDLNTKNKLLLFDIYQNIEGKQKNGKDTTRIAFAFLSPVGSDGSMNTNQDLKLQLYKVKKSCKISHQDCNVYHLYSEHKLKKSFGCLEVAVKGVIPIKVKCLNNADNEEKRSLIKENLKIEHFTSLQPVTKIWEWSRLPTQTCKVPNKIYKTLRFGKNGFSCLQFNRSGMQVAASILSKIIIYGVVAGNEITVLSGHMGFIYELAWSFDDNYLLSVSNDCRGAIWSVNQKTPLFLLPHPCYVYCGKWLTNEQIITGGKDQMIRHWSKSEGGFDLLEETAGHNGFISSLAIQDHSLLISGDALGNIIIRKFLQGTWATQKKLCFSETSDRAIDTILIHSSRRIIISVRTRSSYLVDIVSGIILQSYKGSVNTYARSTSCLTPCGSYLFSFCQNGDIGVWEVNTGKLLASYNNIFSANSLFELSGNIHYHPFDHMVGIVAIAPNHPLLILKYEMSEKDDSKKLGLSFSSAKPENLSSMPLLNCNFYSTSFSKAVSKSDLH